ncbi:winged helix DNA-binding domain-containing protein [soil metagenome]
MNIRDVAGQRMHNQRLIGAAFETPEAMIRWHGAVQAQDYAGAKWGIGQRCHSVTDAELDRLFNEGAILRTHVMRPTWHAVMPEDIRWMQALTAHRVHAMNRAVAKTLDLDDAVVAKSTTLITNALQGGNHLTRTELSDALRLGGIEATGQLLAYLVMHAELEALICSGPRRGKEFTYALLDERVPPTNPLHRDEALAELTRRYFTSHGPATPHDFSWWSGLTVAVARAGIAMLGHELASELIDGTTWHFASTASFETAQLPVVHLLPNFDEYFIGFRNREPVFVPAMLATFNDPHSPYWMAHVIALDGLIVGGWRRTLARDKVIITTTLPAGLNATGRDALLTAAEGYGRFLGLPVRFDAGDV